MQRTDSVVLATWDPPCPMGAGGERQGLFCKAEGGDRRIVCRTAVGFDDRPGDTPDGRSFGMELVDRGGVHVGHDDGRGSRIPSSNGPTLREATVRLRPRCTLRIRKGKGFTPEFGAVSPGRRRRLSHKLGQELGQTSRRTRKSPGQSIRGSSSVVRAGDS
jgi:hypothetical protein